MGPTLSSVDQQYSSPMISDSNPAPSAARVRENQRRSRARRKEHLQCLEQKLRKCEQAGVKASVDMQLAARKVMEENLRLREENERLRQERENLRGENETMKAVLHENQRKSAEASSGEGYRTEPSSGIGDEEPEAPSQLQDTTDRPLEEPTIRLKGEKICTLPTTTYPESPPGLSHVSQNNEMVLSDDTSSCEYAAHIITSMRADISTDDVRADLGCGGDVTEWRKCKVDNSRLFVAVDRYTG